MDTKRAAVGSVLALAAAIANAQPTTYAIAFRQQSGLPADVDAVLGRAGGTIVARLPEIGGVAATSAAPGFAARVAQDRSVKSADVAATARTGPRTMVQGPGLVFPTATCQGASGAGAGAGNASFFGKGIVDAVRAVTAQ
jgi:hypothetical protein